MKKSILARALALVLCFCMVGSLALTGFAAEPDSATIDNSKVGSINIYKYDMTNAEKDGVWDKNYVSTGRYDENVNKLLGEAVRDGDDDANSDLGNNEASNGYAIKGVEFSYLKIADVVQFSESAVDGVTYNHVEVLCGINQTTGRDLLSAIGLTSEQRYANADGLSNNTWYFQSDVLINGLRTALEKNATDVKDKLEAYMKAQNAATMPETDVNGHTSVTDLPLGLYLLVETKVPEMVTSTINPFFVSVPVTTVDGGGGKTSTSVTDGGESWIYDITLYPKNETGIPTLEKTVRESMADTGKNTGSLTSIADGYAHTGTGSAGDVMEYQIISTLPSITSTATQLATYTFADTLEAGLTYNKGDVVLEFFKNADCTESVAKWVEGDGKFTVTYQPGNADTQKDVMMTIAMTDTGLNEINTATTVWSEASELRRGYSDLTLRITYAATIDSDSSLVLGDTGNPNNVVLTWRRSANAYYDVLVDDCHVYSFGIDLTKAFAGFNGNPAVDGDYANVKFVLYNNTDKYWVKATLNAAEGIYYVDDHLTGDNGGFDAQEAAEAAGATQFVPVASNGVNGKVIIKGLEDDEYILTEIETDSGYTLLKDSIKVIISTKETEGLCDIYTSDVLGLIQNDDRYDSIINTDVSVSLGLHNMPQEHLEHHLLTASATVDDNAVTMLEDAGSVNAEAPLTVVNTHGPDLPQTGETGTNVMMLVGASVAACAVVVIFFMMMPRKKSEEQ